MSWLNLNQSLSSIKGQITSFASEVLNEGTSDESDPLAQLEIANKKIQELEDLCATQDKEIKSLRRKNVEYHQANLSAAQVPANLPHTTTGNDSSHDDSSWFWDPPEESSDGKLKEENDGLLSQIKNYQREISNLNAQLDGSQNDVDKLRRELKFVKDENGRLVKSLEDLDAQSQVEIEKIMLIKKDLQKNYEAIQKEYDVLKENYETMKDTLHSEKEDDEKRLLQSHESEEHAKLQKNYEIIQVKYDKLEKVHRLLIENTERFQEDNQFMAEENSKLQSDLEDLNLKFDSLEKSHKKLVEEMERIQEEVHELTEENFKLQEEHSKLHDDANNALISKNANIIEPKNQVTIEQYQELEEKFAKLEMQVANKVPNKIETHAIYEAGAQILIDQLKSEIAELQNKLNTNEEIKRLNLENENLKKELALLNNSNKSEIISCDVIKNMFDKHISFDVSGLDKKLKYSHSSNDVIAYAETCLKNLSEYKKRNETLEIRVAEDSKEINKLKSKIDEINEEMYILNRDLSQCEHECNEMKKNNDFLIAEIGALKCSSKLEPILEQNEDNVLMLQNELEDCSNLNKSIEAELQHYKDELDASKQENNKLKQALEEAEEKTKSLIEECKTSQENSSLDTESNLKQLLSESESKVEKLKSNLCMASAENEKRKIDMTIIENEKILLMKELSETNTYIANITEHFEKIKAEKTHLENQLLNFTELNMKLETANTENSQLKISLKDLQEQVLAAESKSVEFRNTMILKDTELQNISKQYTEANEKLSLIEKENTILQQTYETKEKELLDASNIIRQLTESKCKLEESIHELESNFSQTEVELNMTVEKLTEDIQKLKKENEQLGALNNDLINHQKDSSESDDLIQTLQNLKSQNSELEEMVKSLENNKATVETELNEYSRIVKEDQVKIAEFGLFKVEMEGKMNSLINEKNELINLVKQKHDESISYHNEIQRLNTILIAEYEKFKKLEEINLILCKDQSQKPEDCANCSRLTSELKERDSVIAEQKGLLEEIKMSGITPQALENVTEKNHFLAEKCEILAKNLLLEQTNSKQINIEKAQALEREQNMIKEIERLRQHLLEIEDLHTQELVGAEQKCQELQASLSIAEEKAKQCSSMYTSNSIRANQEVETLRNQLRLIEKQRDDIQAQLYQSEDRNNKNLAALTNLQCVLEQFQIDKSRDVENASGRIRKELEHCRSEKQQLESEILSLQEKLKESNNGLKAASRLSSQLDARAAQLNEMKETVAKLEEELAQWKQKYHNTISNQQDRVDKSLVKNLVIGLIQASAHEKRDQRMQTLKLLSTVLDFDQKETERVGLASPPSQHESLMKEFVKFMERESRPPLNTVLPNLLNLGQSGTAEPGKPPSRRTSEIGSPPFSHHSNSPSSQISTDSRNSPSQRISPKIVTDVQPAPIPIVIATEISPRDSSTASGNAILDAAASVSDLITGVNQTRNTQGAILKNVLLDS